jgi:hypothetical protein
MVTAFNYDLDQSPGSTLPPLSPQLVTCKGQAIWYLDRVDTICSRYRVSEEPD